MLSGRFDRKLKSLHCWIDRSVIALGDLRDGANNSSGRDGFISIETDKLTMESEA